MNHKLATAMAVVLVAGMAGLSATPTAAAVSPDCDDEFPILHLEPPVSRELAGNGEETGSATGIALTGDERVTVQLVSNNDKLEFGVFVVDPDTQQCVSATSLNLSDCGAAEQLDTTPGSVTQVQTNCQIDAPNEGTRDYFFHMKNLQSDALEYKIWQSS